MKNIVESESNIKTSQELRMLSSVTLNCQVTKIIMNSGSQLSDMTKNRLMAAFDSNKGPNLKVVKWC